MAASKPLNRFAAESGVQGLIQLLCATLFNAEDVHGDHENDVFELHPSHEDWEPDQHDGQDAPPNFRFKVTGYTVGWYKHLGRSMEVPEITSEQLLFMSSACLASLEPK
jgi:hypothetical protein